MNDDLHDRIGRVTHTRAFEQTLEEGGESVIEFQLNWHEESGEDFSQLSPLHQRAILAGERECSEIGEFALV